MKRLLVSLLLACSAPLEEPSSSTQPPLAPAPPPEPSVFPAAAVEKPKELKPRTITASASFFSAAIGPDAPEDLTTQPTWGRSHPYRVITVAPDPRASPQERGDELAAAAESLQPGDMLQIGGGVYALHRKLVVRARGQEGAPIWIAPRGREPVTITRFDASQNVINLDGARFLVLRDLEITGGSQGIHIEDASQIWIDRCHIHDTGEAGITANSGETSFLFLTRNEIHHTSGTGEGMYLGANNGAHVMRRSVIAWNHVHHTGGSQGDGIEVKQGSWGNRVVGNWVHDTPYPSIIVYGTDGQARNVVERNLCQRSGDNLMQVQGEALVANNLLVGGAIGFHSHDHQGQTRDLAVVHNTIITNGPATDLYSWNGRTGMVFANNAVYSSRDVALSFPNGAAGVQLLGNVVFGQVVGVGEGGWSEGRGLADFAGLDWAGSVLGPLNLLLAQPLVGGALIGAADPTQNASDDLTGATRVAPLDAGCLDGP